MTTNKFFTSSKLVRNGELSVNKLAFFLNLPSAFIILLVMYFRQQKNVKAKIVVVEGESPIKTSLNEYRWIPKAYSLPSSTIIYGNKVANLLWGDTPLGIIIKSKEVADSYDSYFKLLWKIGKKK